MQLGSLSGRPSDNNAQNVTPNDIQFFYYFQSKYQNSLIIFKITWWIQLFEWAILNNKISAIKEKDFIDLTGFSDGRLRLISSFSKSLNFENYALRQQVYGMQFGVHEIIPRDIIKKLDKTY